MTSCPTGVGPSSGRPGARFDGERAERHLLLRYRLGEGELYEGDALRWLPTLPGASVDLVVADPPYNIGKASWDVLGAPDDYVRWCLQWIREAARILKPTGSMFICGFSETLADLRRPAAEWFPGCRWLVWYYRNKANLGLDWGRSHESILHLRKGRRFRLEIDRVRIPHGRHTTRYPDHPQAETSHLGGRRPGSSWRPHPLGAKPRDVIEIPTTCNGSRESTPHPTQKPEELLRKLLLSSSSEGDLVVDPFSGSGTTLVVAEQLGRRWLGCEREPSYNHWAMDRLDMVERRSATEWLELDRASAERRASIR